MMTTTTAAPGAKPERPPWFDDQLDNPNDYAIEPEGKR
jgi:hypothetical protein